MTVFKYFLKWYNNKGCSSNAGSNAKKDSVLSQQGDRYVETWLYSSKSNNYMSTQIYKLQVYPFCESDKNLCEKIREYMTGGPLCSLEKL